MKENNSKSSPVQEDLEEVYKVQIDSASVNGSYPGEKREKRPDEIPEKSESEKENLIYPHETEVSKPDSGNDISYGEQGDVTPRAPHEFPSFSNVRTDFAARKQGRTTGRILGHEPGTESI